MQTLLSEGAAATRICYLNLHHVKYNAVLVSSFFINNKVFHKPSMLTYIVDLGKSVNNVEEKRAERSGWFFSCIGCSQRESGDCPESCRVLQDVGEAIGDVFYSVRILFDFVSLSLSCHPWMVFSQVLPLCTEACFGMQIIFA